MCLRAGRLTLCVAICVELCVASGCGRDATPAKAPMAAQKPDAVKAKPVGVKAPAAKASVPKTAKKPPAPPKIDLNLVKNGSFETWTKEQWIPANWGFVEGAAVNPANMPYSLKRVESGAPDGKLAIEQVWKEADGKCRAVQRLGATLEGLKPRTSYQFNVRAKMTGNGLVTVSPYALVPAEKSPKEENLRRSMVVLKPGAEFQEYTGYFSTADVTTVRICTCCGKADSFPVSVIWDDFRVRELGPAAPKSGAAPAASAAPVQPAPAATATAATDAAKPAEAVPPVSDATKETEEKKP